MDLMRLPTREVRLASTRDLVLLAVVRPASDTGIKPAQGPFHTAFLHPS